MPRVDHPEPTVNYLEQGIKRGTHFPDLVSFEAAMLQLCAVFKLYKDSDKGRGFKGQKKDTWS